MKATLHIINRYFIWALLFFNNHGCSTLYKKEKKIFLREGYESERLSSIKNHYNILLTQYLNHVKSRKINKRFLGYINSLVEKHSLEEPFINVIIVDENSSSYFVSPDGRLIFTEKFAKNYFLNEQLLTAFLLENVTRLKKMIYTKKSYYPSGLVSMEDLSKLMILSRAQKDKLNYYCVEELIKHGSSPMTYLNYIQQRNKDSSLVSNLINGSVFGLEEERRLKTYLIEQHKKVFIEKVELETSTKSFYLFKMSINEVF